jgi:hypothetical protein
MHDTDDDTPGTDLVPASALVLAAKPPPNDGRTWRYDRELAARIADAVADNVSLHEQRALDPLTVPPVTVLMAWRKQHPEFGLLLDHAERVRADLLAEQALVLADTAKGQPARVALMISTRLKTAERLDPDRFGSGGAAGAPAAGKDDQPTAPQLTDDQLAALATMPSKERV